MTDTRAQLVAAAEPPIRNDLHAPSPIPAGVIASHVIDALLALPRVAIVELPESIERGSFTSTIGGWISFPQSVDAVITEDERFVAELDSQMTTSDARALAAALLAAANAAEREAK